MKIIITGYSFIYQRFFKMFDYFPADFEFIFILPKTWPAKKGKVIYQPPVSKKFKVITIPAYFYHSNYPIIGGILKGWQPKFKKVLADLIAKEKIDLIYNASEPHLLATYFNSLAAKACHLPQIIFSWENIPFKSKFKGIKLKIFEYLINKNLAIASGLICGNQKAKQIFDQYNRSLPKIICPLSGVNTDLFKPGTKANDKIVFLFAGALGKRKGIFLIVNAFKELIKKYPNISLTFCGAGEDEQELRNKVTKENLENNVQFINWLPPEKLADLFKQVDVFLYPSIPENGWEEQFGFAMAEASAAGLPVIATKIGSINEVVIDGQTGILIPANDQGSLQQAMEKLIIDKELRIKLGKNGRQFIETNYSYQKVAARLAQFFQQIIN